jgi:AraC-like DNA-binding protein
MSLTLSEDQYEQFWQQCQELAVQADPKDPFDCLIPYPSSLAYGHKRNLTLRSGIELTLHQYTFHQDVQWIIEPGEGDLLELVFNLGSPYQRADGKAIQTGQHYWIGSRLGERLLATAHQARSRQAVDVHLRPALLQQLLGEQQQDLPPDWQALVLSTTDRPFLTPQITLPAMQMALHQILDCPFQGATKHLFLEGKVFELLALQLDSLLRRDPPRVPAPLEQIHQAREILEQRMTDPPSLLELAQLAGLNDYSLKAGFRQFFGTTVFGYLLQKRMEQARTLLESNKLTIPGVAHAVGYASATAFSKAFRKRFGITPKQYQISQRH